MEWLLFFALIAVLLFIDLSSHKEDKAIAIPEALKQSALWIGLSCLFGAGLWHFMGAARGAEFFTAYIIEKSLSVDNLFVFLAIFTYFNIADKYQHKVLYWGIIGAVVLRFIAIAGGVSLLHTFHWLTYVFGAILLYTSYKVAFAEGDGEVAFDQTWFAKWLNKHFMFNWEEPERSNGHFWFKEHATVWNASKGLPQEVGFWFTKLFFVLVIIEATDLLFATDSIPAALACSDSAFVIFSSNIFAVLGLRSLYFALSSLMDKFEFLKYGVSAVLALIGLKMVLASVFVAPTFLWLAVVAIILTSSVLASMWIPKHE